MESRRQRQNQVPGMKWGRFIAFLFGVSALAALTVYAGADSVMRTLGAFGVTGLLLVALLHLPLVALMGMAWRLIGRDITGASYLSFSWARLVRDAAAEVLPFSQIGGFVFGVRALHLEGVGAVRGALTASIDLVMELWAKLPYFLAGLGALLALAPNSRIAHTMFLALGFTSVIVAIPLLFQGRLRRTFEISTTFLSRRWPAAASRDDVKSLLDGIVAHPRYLFLSFAVHFCCWILGSAEMWMVFALIGNRITILQALAIDSSVSGLRTFAFLVPAAAGVQEASYVLVCAVLGISPAVAVAVSLARRARDWALGVPTLAVWQFFETRVRTS